MSATANPTKMRANGFKYKVLEVAFDGRLYFKFGFNRALMAEIKAMEGSQFHAPPTAAFQSKPAPKEVTALTLCHDWVHSDGTKLWSVPDTQHNRFQLDYMKGGNPYARYELPLPHLQLGLRETVYGELLKPYTHQCEMVSFFNTRKYCIAAAEMGTGKTLAAIYTMEMSGHTDWWYVAPRSALRAVARELRFWKSKVMPELMTYDELVKRIRRWELDGRGMAPRGIIFDEASRVKTPTSQRSQAAAAVADGIRDDWAEDGSVILMSGSPAPRNPTDWWMLCRIACPGFLREGTIEKFKNRLGLIVMRKNEISGGNYPQLIAWRDDESKCEICGKTAEEHEAAAVESLEAMESSHVFKPSVNEVTKLNKRMKGLVQTWLKKDCLSELPDKIYRIIRCKPTGGTLRAAKILKSRARSVIEGLTMLRELSDGFQYAEEANGEETCPRCQGTCRTKEWVDRNDPDGERLTWFAEGNEGIDEGTYELREIPCESCENGKIPRLVRTAKIVDCPKQDALIELLEEHEDCGRIVIYGGFTESVDRCVTIAQSQKWAVIRWDGRGVACMDEEGQGIKVDPLEMFQDLLDKHPRVAFVGQPGAAGMGLTLTKSPSIVYYSNDFNFESRIQSEDRIHRPGMDIAKGATIIDLIHLPSDEYVLNNLKAKKRLQQMTLTGLDFALTENDERLF